LFLFTPLPPPPRSPLFPYTTLFRSPLAPVRQPQGRRPRLTPRGCPDQPPPSDEGQPCGRIREKQRHHRSLVPREAMPRRRSSSRSEEHTSELQSRFDLVCRLLLEKK